MKPDYKEIPGLPRTQGRMEDEPWYPAYQSFMHFTLFLDEYPTDVFEGDVVESSVLYEEYLKHFKKEYIDDYESFPEHTLDQLRLFCNYWAPQIPESIKENKRIKEEYPPEKTRSPSLKEYLKKQGRADLSEYGFDEEEE